MVGRLIIERQQFLFYGVRILTESASTNNLFPDAKCFDCYHYLHYLR